MPSEIGSDFFREGSLDVVYTDTLSLQVSTTIVDSLITSNTGRLLVGYHNDEDLGSIYAASFFQVEPKSSIEGSYFLDQASTDYLRTTLTLWYDGYSYYDTLNNQSLLVHQLADEIELYDNGYLYNTSATKYSSTPLGQLTYKPKPLSGDSIEVPLSDLFGSSIYNRSILEDENLTSTDDFVKNILKGLAVVPDITVNDAMVGFDTRAEVRVYYRDRSVVPSEENYLRFFVSTLQYNQIKANRTLTPLQSLTTSKEKLSTSLTNRKTYAQGGSGLYIRVEIPHLKTILIDNPKLIITEADLTFKPIKNTYRNNEPLTPRLKLYAANENNRIYAEFVSTVEGEGYANLIEDRDLERDTYYKANVTEFIKAQLATEENNKNALLLSLSNEELQSTVNRLYVGDQKNDYSMELKVYFAVIR
jgi:Domain of unknown function (DUF4270)